MHSSSFGVAAAVVVVVAVAAVRASVVDQDCGRRGVHFDMQSVRAHLLLRALHRPPQMK